MLGLSRQAVAWMLRNGRIRGERYGRSWAVSHDEVVAERRRRERLDQYLRPKK